MKPRIPTAILVHVIVLLAAAASLAQTSIGFSDPDDLEALLSYRLPTWSYRTWTVNGGLDGSGSESWREDFYGSANNFHLILGTAYRWNRESDTRDLRLGVEGGGRYSRSRSGQANAFSRGSDVSGDGSLTGGYRLAPSESGPWYSVDAYASRNYRESDRQQMSPTDQYTETSRLTRQFRNRATLSVGIGRIRDVTPLVRAQRLSERLAALGRQPLTAAEVRRVAEVIAVRHGYGLVYQRSDRYFWRDALEPALAGREPLTPFEMHYLMEVLQENVGARRQGFEFAVHGEYEGSGGETEPGNDHRYDVRSLGAGVAYVRNASLQHQLTADVRCDYAWYNGRDGEGQSRLYARLAHLWVVADRYHLDTSLALQGSYAQRPSTTQIARSLATILRSDLTVFVEDQLRVVAGVRVGNEQASGEPYDFRAHGWNWSYKVGLQYDLQRVFG